jgi:hypothetical protein
MCEFDDFVFSVQTNVYLLRSSHIAQTQNLVASLIYFGGYVDDISTTGISQTLLINDEIVEHGCNVDHSSHLTCTVAVNLYCGC